MTLYKYCIYSICLCKGMLLYAQPSHNVTDSIAASFDLNEVVVSSFKETFHTKDLPASVSVLSARQLQRNSMNSLKSITAFSPNLYMPDYGSKLNSPIYIRGIGSRTNAPSVGLYVDGIPYFERSAFDFDFFDIEYVEVLRGPQGTLYGRNTMGGIVNVATKSPLQHQGTKLHLSGGNYEYLKATLTNYSKIGNRWGIASGINYLHRGGYFTNQYSNELVDRQNDVSARLRLTFRHNEQTRSELHVNYEHSRQDGYPYAVYNLVTGKVDSVNYNDDSSYTRDMLSAGYQFERDTRWGTIKALTGYQFLKDKQAVDQDYSPKPIYFVVQDMTQNMLSQEVILKSKTDRSYRWVTGMFGFVQQIDNNVAIHKQLSDTYDLRYYDQPTYGLAVYHQSSYNNLLVKGLSGSLGLRLDYENARQKYMHDVTTAISLEETDRDNTRLNFFELLPKFALRYEYASQSVYASVAKGYKTGGFNVSFDTDDEKSFGPETSWNYEIGLKMTLFRHTIIETAAFYIDWDNQQITQSLTSKIGSMIRNAGRSESKGIELSISSQLYKNLNLNLNYGYTHATFKDYLFTSFNGQSQSIDSIDYSGNFVPQVPRQTLSAGVTYRLPVAKSWLDDVVLHARYTGIGKIYWVDNNEVSQGNYGLLDANVCFTRSFISLAVWAKNLLNTDYFAYYFKSGNSFVQTGKPVTIGVDISINF